MSVTWRPLEDGFVRINFDLAHNRHQFRSISGLVARNSNGEVLASQATLEKEITSSFAAEACACTRVVRLGIQMGHRLVSSGNWNRHGNVVLRNEDGCQFIHHDWI
ncbi:hypothetical protein Gotur_005094 [Gossypium turneri]